MSLLLLLLYTSIMPTAADVDSVHCFAAVHEQRGECEDYLGEGVSDVECCLNNKYAFKVEEDSPCQACRLPEWSQWSSWSGCTVSCLEGVEERRRICIGQGDCEGDEVEVQSCSLQDCCPQAGRWSEWSSWSDCSVTCEIGQSQRTRQCNNPPPLCGGGCGGSGIETRVCDTQQVCPVHGSWSDWGPWGQCSASCTVEGSKNLPVQSRNRDCSNPAPSAIPPGRPCEGSNQDTRDCRDLPFCEVNGVWGQWEDDSECSVTCGVGRKRQKRFCNNPAPKHGGKDCAGSPGRTSICNTKRPCPIDGTWSAWGEWSECARLQQDNIACQKKIGNQNRLRECQGQSHGGQWCEGPYRESRACYNIQGCPLKGSWSEWSPWGLCSSACGAAERARSKVCVPQYPDYPDIVPGATRTVEVFFSGAPIPRCTPIDKERFKVVEKTECKNLPSCP